MLWMSSLLTYQTGLEAEKLESRRKRPASSHKTKEGVRPKFVPAKGQMQVSLSFSHVYKHVWTLVLLLILVLLCVIVLVVVVVVVRKKQNQ
jgi:CHASE1-domain containing sensor protein